MATRTTRGWSAKTSGTIWTVAMICQLSIFAVPAYSLYRNIGTGTETTTPHETTVSVGDMGFILIALLFNLGTATAMLSQFFCYDLNRSQRWLRTIGTFALGVCVTAIFVTFMFSIAMTPGLD